MQARMGQYPIYQNSKLYHLIEDLYAIIDQQKSSKLPKVQKQFELLLKHLKSLHDILDGFSEGGQPGYGYILATIPKVPGMIKDIRSLDLPMIIENLPIDAQIEIFELIKGQGSLEDLLSFIDPAIPQKNLGTIQNIIRIAGGRRVKSLKHKSKDNTKFRYEVEFEEKSPNLALDLNEHYQEIKKDVGAKILQNIKDEFINKISQRKDLEGMAYNFMVIKICKEAEKKALTIIESGLDDEEDILSVITGTQKGFLREIFGKFLSNFEMVNESQDFLLNKVKKLEEALSKIEQLYDILAQDEMPAEFKAEFKNLENEMREVIREAEEELANANSPEYFDALIKKQEEVRDLKMNALTENTEKIGDLHVVLHDLLTGKGSYRDKLEDVKKTLESNEHIFSGEQVEQVVTVLNRAEDSEAHIHGTVQAVINSALHSINKNRRFFLVEEKGDPDALVEKTEKIEAVRALHDKLKKVLAGKESYDEKLENITAIFARDNHILSKEQEQQIITALGEVNEAKIFKTMNAHIRRALHDMYQEFSLADGECQKTIDFFQGCKKIASGFNEISKSWKELKEKISADQNANTLSVSEYEYLLGLDISKLKTKIDELESQMISPHGLGQEEDKAYESFKELFAEIINDIKNFEDALIQAYVEKVHKSDIKYLQKELLSLSGDSCIEYNKIIKNLSDWSKKIIEENVREEKEGFFDNPLFKARDLASKNKKNINLKLKDFLANPCWREFYKAIVDSHNHGVEVLREGQKNNSERDSRLGMDFILFCAELIREDIVNYLASSNKDLEEFCNECAAKLEGKLQDHSIGQHRKIWSSCAARLAKLGCAFFAVRSVIRNSCAASSREGFFETKRQKQIVKTKQVVTEKLNPRNKHH